LSASALALFFFVALGRPSAWDEGEARMTSLPGFDNPHDVVRENGTYGGQGKAVGCVPPTALLFVHHRHEPLKSD
jgi:hypothetical protein